LALGKTLDAAYAISEADIEAELDGYPEKKKDYPERSLLALRAAIDDFRAKRAAGAIPDEALERAHREAAAVRAATTPGNGTTSQDDAQAPQVADDAGKVLIKLR
jgi:hypothetical protein